MELRAIGLIGYLPVIIKTIIECRVVHLVTPLPIHLKRLKVYGTDSFLYCHCIVEILMLLNGRLSRFSLVFLLQKQTII